MYLNTEDMIGDPYNFINYTKQSKVFDIKGYDFSNTKVNSIILYFY
jgi:hypothetical protein